MEIKKCFIFITLILLVNCNNLVINNKPTPGDALFRWMEFAKSIGVETNAAILDLELVTKNPNVTIADSYVIKQYINNIKEVYKPIINDTENIKEKRQCFSCGYAGACVNTCPNGTPSKCENDCVEEALDKATDSLGDIFFDILFLPAAEISFGFNVIKCMTRC